MRNALMVAYHFPPSAVSSGHLRTLALARYLPEFGWAANVLSAHPRAYSRRDDRLLAEVPAGLPVSRAFALDARQHMSFRGAYPLLLAQPDRWISWWFAAVPRGLWLIRKYNPQVIWSTYPIITAHLIAYTLHRLTGIPWIADFRDPVSTSDLGPSALTERTRRWIERRTVEHAAAGVFTTAGAMADCARRYPARTESLTVIPNGYDERDFASLGTDVPSVERPRGRRVTLVHSGLLYREGRNPYPLFEALAQLRGQGRISGESLHVVLRASGHEDAYAAMIEALALADIVSLEPPLPYRQALAEQAGADGLLLFQGSVFNRQIPAKFYEYLRVGRPIFALTDPAGDTAALLRTEGITSVAAPEDSSAIATSLSAFLTRIQEGAITTPARERVAQYSRQASAQRYAAVFDAVAGD